MCLCTHTHALIYTLKYYIKVVGMKEHSYLQTLYEKSVLREAYKILNDTTHILNPEFEMLPSGRRFRMPRCRLNRFKNSFIPSATKALNSSMWVAVAFVFINVLLRWLFIYVCCVLFKCGDAVAVFGAQDKFPCGDNKLYLDLNITEIKIIINYI